MTSIQVDQLLQNNPARLMHRRANRHLGDLHVHLVELLLLVHHPLDKLLYLGAFSTYVFPVLNPTIYLSADGGFELDVDPREPNGSGPA